ncbi:hypothetical protein VTN77DRAFT_7564 [Rasamsonia byssochlamydoides]|uniref:uncharacterized protein n=1 Tax=Rasamsonia byssochlamydoides TaxID=89139 RepID=UPI003742D9F4
MRQINSLQVLAAALLLVALANGLPHEGGDSMDMNMDMDMGASKDEAMPKPAAEDGPTSYFSYPEHVGTIFAHIILMVIAWCFILPIAVMFSVARSRYTIPTQFVFLILNGLGLFFGIVYNASTPDLYENNAHHKIGWIVTWVVVAQFVIGLIYAYSGHGRVKNGATYERATFLPVSNENMMEHQQSMGTVQEYRWSRDSGQGTERNTSSLQSRPSTPDGENERFTKPEEDAEESTPLAQGWLRNSVLDRFFASRIPGLVSSRVLRILRVVYIIIDRIILPFGFIAVSTGGVTYGGIFKASGIFSGLAHFIKGGIFFWYGLVVLGRFMGCWADFGWAWNVKPPQQVVGKSKSRVPTAEFIESAAIFFYGSTNVFLEHLGGWGGAWTATDLEHLSIAVMFFGAGLCGMLLESKRVREWLNKTVLHPYSHVANYGQPDTNWETPGTVSINPMPALIVFLLGIMMGAHHQESMVSTMVHKQWGSLLAAGALARACTYIFFYIKPPTSYLPSRPPSEVVGAFCLIAGGLIFMLSASDVVDVMLYYDLDAMFTFNIVVGLTCFIMAYEILVIAIKAWAVKKESPSQPHPPSWLPAA